MLTTIGPQSVVIQEDVEHPHWKEIKKNYNQQGGIVVYFGIFGEFAAPARISKELKFGKRPSGKTMADWKFSAYAAHDYGPGHFGYRHYQTEVHEMQSVVRSRI